MELGNMIYGHSYGPVALPRTWQDKFAELLKACGLDGYGEPATEEAKSHSHELTATWRSRPERNTVYENDMFSIMPYFWGDSSSIYRLPNFVFKPTSYELRWYKYPLRDSYASAELTQGEFDEMVEQCIGYVKKEMKI